MRWEISTGPWMSWFLGRRNSTTITTITTIARRQTRTPVRPVRGSELVAMVDPGAEVTKVRIAEQPRGHHATSRHGLAALIITAWSRNCPRRPRVCARHM